MDAELMQRIGLTYYQWIDCVRLCYDSEIDTRNAYLLMTTISEAARIGLSR